MKNNPIQQFLSLRRRETDLKGLFYCLGLCHGNLEAAGRGFSARQKLTGNCLLEVGYGKVSP
jgi:hypothetical protein